MADNDELIRYGLTALFLAVMGGLFMYANVKMASAIGKLLSYLIMWAFFAGAIFFSVKVVVAVL